MLRTSQFEDTEMQNLLKKNINEYLNALNEKQNISNIRWDRSICKYVTRKKGKLNMVKIPKKLYLLYILSCMMVYTYYWNYQINGIVICVHQTVYHDLMKSTNN